MKASICQRTLYICATLILASETHANTPKEIREASLTEAAANATRRSSMGRRSGISIGPDQTLKDLGQRGRANMAAVCGRGQKGKARQATTVTHYYIPVLKNFSKSHCHNMEGVCFFQKQGETWLANYGHRSTPLRKAFCKNGIGYGLTENCTHPCRTLAAATSKHRGGEIIFFPELVGKRCGTGKNAMIHDGFMVVNDTGAVRFFNQEGRFAFFWGECRKFKNGVCRDPGALEISRILSRSKFCRAWTPQDSSFNTDIQLAMQNAVRSEALIRGDDNAALVTLSTWVSPSHSQAGVKMRRLRMLAEKNGLPARATAIFQPNSTTIDYDLLESSVPVQNEPEQVLEQ